MNEIAPANTRPAATTELDRFLVLFDRLVAETDLWIEATPADKLDWVAIDTEQVRFGDRLTRVTIKSLYLHMAVAEHHWIRGLRDCENGVTIPLPRDPELTGSLNEAEDFVARCGSMHRDDMAVLRGFTGDILDKQMTFAGDDSEWSVMGFLWGMYGHRSYHLGNLDLYLRQSDTPTPDFFSFNPKAMA